MNFEERMRDLLIQLAEGHETKAKTCRAGAAFEAARAHEIAARVIREAARTSDHPEMR